MEIPILKGGQTGRLEVDTSFLGDKVKTKTLRSAVIMYQANKRVGTHNTLTRAEVARAKKPLFKQKHTGRARVKHPQVPQCRGGGVAHGPHPRDYSYRMPKKALRVALRAALLSKFHDGEVAAVDAFRISKPRTAEIVKTLDAMKCRASCLIIVDQFDANLHMSVRNLPRVKMVTVADLNAYDVVFHRNMLITEAALAKMKEVHGHA